MSDASTTSTTSDSSTRVFWARKVATLLHQERSSDVVLKTGGGQYLYCHRVFLAAHSPVFDQLLYGDDSKMKNSSCTQLSYQGKPVVPIAPACISVSVEAVLSFLGYFYSGQATLTDEILTQVHQLAVTYEVELLQTLCESLMVTQPTLVKSLHLMAYTLEMERNGLDLSKQVLRVPQSTLNNEEAYFRDRDEVADLLFTFGEVQTRAKILLQAQFEELVTLSAWREQR